MEYKTKQKLITTGIVLIMLFTGIDYFITRIGLSMGFIELNPLINVVYLTDYFLLKLIVISVFGYISIYLNPKQNISLGLVTLLFFWHCIIILNNLGLILFV